MNRGKFVAKRVASVAVLTALSLITFLIENLFPPLFIPGAKLGLANAFSFAALIIYTPLEAFIVVSVRTLLGAVFAGNISAVLYSFTGGVISMSVSSVLMYTAHPRVSVISISVIAAVLHNLTQNAVFVLLSFSPLAFSYAPYLTLLGILSGAFIGAVVTAIFKRVPESAFLRVAGLTDRVTENAATAGSAENPN